VGVGDSLEAAYALRGPVPAGVFRLVGDGILAGEGVTFMDVRFDVLHRPMAGGGGEALLVRFENRFVRDLSARFRAVRYERAAEGPGTSMSTPTPAGGSPGLLVLRVTALDGSVGGSFILNGDGDRAGGRIPRLDLPGSR
jgi:hypothetical protein